MDKKLKDDYHSSKINYIEHLNNYKATLNNLAEKALEKKQQKINLTNIQPIHEKKISQSFEEAESVSLEEELSENKSQSNVYMIEDQLDTLESRIDLIKKTLEKNSIKIKHQNYEDKNTQTNQ